MTRRITTKELQSLDTYESYFIPTILFEGEPTDRLSLESIILYSVLMDLSKSSYKGIVAATPEQLSNLIHIKLSKVRKGLIELQNRNLINVVSKSSHTYKVNAIASLI